MKKSSLAQKYVKYLIKNPLLFLLCVGIGTGMFLYLTLSTKLPIIRTYNAHMNFSGESCCLTIDSEDQVAPEVIYVYQDKYQHVITLPVEKTEMRDGQTVFYTRMPEKQTLEGITAWPWVDVPVEKTSLFMRIFARGGRG